MPDTLQAPIQTKRNKISVYFLASPEDEDECKAIQKYLSPVIRNSRIPIEIGSDFIIPENSSVSNNAETLLIGNLDIRHKSSIVIVSFSFKT